MSNRRTEIPKIALIGDYDPAVIAHQAIPAALRLATINSDAEVSWDWVETASLGSQPARSLVEYRGIWTVPASPYADTGAVIAAIRFARESGLPFLGTCGGFQHVLLEYAQANWGMQRPTHAELDPEASDPLIAPLACSLVEVEGELHLTAGSRLARIYGSATAVEGYHCRYGLNPKFAAHLDHGPLRVGARDGEGDIRAVELEGHAFYMATLFQPERSGLAGRSHPLIAAFVAAVLCS